LKELQQRINNFSKISYTNSVGSPIEIARRTTLANQPFAAKL